MPKELSKCREWEKERRIRLNEAFLTLCKVLPCYDPAVNTKKIDILKNATTCIEELQDKVKNLISCENDKVDKKIKGDEIKKLQERVKKLLFKNEQLCRLLRDAKITIPPECDFRKFKNPRTWSHKITAEQAKIFQKKEAEKENLENGKKSVGKKFKNKKVNNTPKHRKAILNRSENKKLRGVKRKKCLKTVSPSKCVIVFSQPSVSQSCYVITNAPSNIIGSSSTVITSSGLLTNPVMSSNTKSNSKSISSISQLGPGTLILANGTIMPVLPQQTVLPIITNPLPLNPRPQNSTVILLPPNPVNLPKSNSTDVNVQNKVITSSSAKSLVKIKPKYCFTRTTQVNKVPIPALTSRYANNDLMLTVKNVSKPNKTLDKKETPKNDKVNDKEPPQLVKVSEGSEKRKLVEESAAQTKKTKTGDKCEDNNKSQGTTNKINDPKNDETEKDKKEAEKIIEEKIQEINKHVSPPQKEMSSSDVVVSIANTENLISKENPEKIPENIGNAIVHNTKTVEPPAKKDDDATTQLDLNINHSELSNDIFASLHVPTGCQNPESTSPTAAFLLAFPLVSSLTGVKVTEVTEEDNNDSQNGTPTLLQIGTMDSTKPTQSQSDSLTPSLLNLDNLSFFSSKDISGFYSSFDNNITTTTTSIVTSTTASSVTKAISAVNGPSNPEINHAVSTIQQKMPPKIAYQHQKPVLDGCFDNATTVINNNNNNQTHTNTGSNGLHDNLVNYQIKNKVNMKSAESKPTCAVYSPQKGYSNVSYNNFTELPKAGPTCSYSTTIKSYPDPLYTNSNSYNYNYPSDTNFNQTYYKNVNKSDNRNYYSLSYENYTDYKKNDVNNTNYYNNTNYSKDKFGTVNNTATNNNKLIKNASTPQTRPPINWMTTPDNRLQTSNDVLPQFTKESDFSHNAFYSNTQTSYFNTNPVYSSSNNNNNIVQSQESRKPAIDLPLMPSMNTYQRNDAEENQFSWSPTKIPQFFDPPHTFVSSTLPTLVGDLALGNPLSFDQKIDTNSKCHNKRDTVNRRIKSYENNQGNFLSVSQLVDHNKNEPLPSRTANRRNSGNRSNNKKVAPQKSSQTRNSKSHENNNHSNNTKVENVNKNNQMKQHMTGYCNDIFNEPKNNRLPPKTNYSAEALIGHQMHQPPDVTQKNRQNYAGGVNKTLPVPSFLPENIIPYFTPVDLQQTDNNYIQQNQNFGHNFPSTFQNNSYTPNTFIPTATTITSTYLGTNNFIHDISSTTHDYSENLNLFPPNKDKNCNKTSSRVNIRDQQNICSVSNTTPNKKSKRKHSNESNLPGFDFPFLSMPGSISSPILPDDFHAHSGFLQPPTPQLYPCKNSLYPKQSDLTSSSLLPLPPVPGTRSGIQHPEISPSLNSAGTSLTNFNLSTIFPEINKGTQVDTYNESRMKDHTVRSYSSSAQVSFNEKPSFSFTYINCPTSQTYNNQ